jgi:hypothetical protein
MSYQLSVIRRQRAEDVEQRVMGYSAKGIEQRAPVKDAPSWLNKFRYLTG